MDTGLLVAPGNNLVKVEKEVLDALGLRNGQHVTYQQVLQAVRLSMDILDKAIKQEEENV